MKLVVVFICIMHAAFSHDSSSIDEPISGNDSLNLACNVDQSEPEQIHLSYTGQTSSMFVTWTSINCEGGSQGKVLLKRVGDNTTIEHVVTPVPLIHIKENSTETRTTFVYRAELTNLEPNTTYVYAVGSPGKDNKMYVSEHFNFTTFHNNTNSSPTICILGDIGVKYNASVPTLINMTENKQFDMVIHLGDIAYELKDDFGRKGDQFTNMIQPIATRVPYNFVAGNHEHFNNFSEFTGRFSSPGPNQFYHSYDVGPIHFVVYTTTFYIYDQYGTDQIQSQYNWLAQDLAHANAPSNRSVRPWIIALGHRPMYCSNFNDTDCSVDNFIRTGYKNQYHKLEDLFYKNGVDVLFFGHKHNYERSYPVYDHKVEKVKDTENYVDPKYPMHIISGSAGMKHKRQFIDPKPEYTVKRSHDITFTLLKVVDLNKLEVKQFSVDKNDTLDMFTITKKSS